MQQQVITYSKPQAGNDMVSVQVHIDAWDAEQLCPDSIAFSDAVISQHQPNAIPLLYSLSDRNAALRPQGTLAQVHFAQVGQGAQNGHQPLRSLWPKRIAIQVQLDEGCGLGQRRGQGAGSRLHIYAAVRQREVRERVSKDRKRCCKGYGALSAHDAITQIQ